MGHGFWMANENRRNFRQAILRHSARGSTPSTSLLPGAPEQMHSDRQAGSPHSDRTLFRSMARGGSDERNLTSVATIYSRFLAPGGRIIPCPRSKSALAMPPDKINVAVESAKATARERSAT